jgi:lipopolysaccharide biosynthesis glycosyltransferase
MYYTTLVGKEKYAFNGNRFIKGERVEISESTYNAVKDSNLFVSEVYGSSDTTKVESKFSNDTMHIALAYSPNWAHHVKKQIYSIFSNNPPPVNIFLLSDELGTIDTRDLCSFFGTGYTCKNINVDQMYKRKITTDVNVSSRFTKYTLYRLLLPSIVNVPRLLYLDSDTLVTGNIRDFYHTDFEGNWLIGVNDIGVAMPTVRKAINFDNEEPYINAGVTLMNMPELFKLQKRWLTMVNEKRYMCHDQDILNITCRGKIKTVTNIYNSSLSTGFAGANTKIAHFAGAKPWTTKAMPKHPYLSWMFDAWKDNSNCFYKRGFSTIPNVIHYCWFGGNEKTDLVKKCIESWKRHMPNTKIVEWNESNFDVTAHGAYVKEAAAQKKWAFVNDYLRLWVLDRFGGITLDSDVMLLRPLDRMLKARAFTGHETRELMVTATIGAEPEHPWIRKLLKYYETAKFSTVPNTNTITKISKGLVVKEDRGYRLLQDDVIIYPVETLCPYDHKNLKAMPTHESYAAHLFSGSWLGRKEPSTDGLC